MRILALGPPRGRDLAGPRRRPHARDACQGASAPGPFTRVRIRLDCHARRVVSSFIGSPRPAGTRSQTRPADGCGSHCSPATACGSFVVHRLASAGGAPAPRRPAARTTTRGGAGMKAAVLYKANTPLEVVDVEQQGPQAGEARVRVMATGVCHSDWHIINGDWTLPLPMVLGHEAAGVVEEVGPGVSNVRRGD